MIKKLCYYSPTSVGFLCVEPLFHMHVAVYLLIKTLTYRPKLAVDIVTTSMYELNERGDRDSDQLLGVELF